MKFKSRQDNSSVQTLTRCIREIEARTRAEVVLVVRRSSGVYRDVDLIVGSVAATGLLLFKLFSDIEFHPASIPLPLVLAFALAARLSYLAGRYGPRRYLTTRKRRETQVRHAAAAAYLDKKIDRVPGGVGILLYFSAIEQRAELIAGEGARTALEPRLEELRNSLQQACSGERTVRGSVDRLAEFLRSFGVLLERSLPCGEGVRPNLLEDMPELEGLGDKDS